MPNLRRALALTLLLLPLLLLAACAASSNVITWETASEVDTAGFNIYRGPTEEGPWTKVNQALIPPSTDPVRGGKYKFTDKEAKPGETNYYLLEEVELSGAVNRYPPQKLTRSATASIPWFWWVVGALLALLLGWWLGGRLRSRKEQET